MAYIGIFGAAVIERRELVPLARRVGEALAEAGAIVITGGCSGLPYQAAFAAARRGAEVWGFPPVRNIEEMQEFVPEDDLSIYSRLVYIPESFPFAHNREVCKKYRNVISTAHCDAGIIISGRWGTLHEFINLIDYGRIAGVLTNTGDIADELPGLTGRIGRGLGREESGNMKSEKTKPGDEKSRDINPEDTKEDMEPEDMKSGSVKPESAVIFESDPEKLVARVCATLLSSNQINTNLRQ